MVFERYDLPQVSMRVINKVIISFISELFLHFSKGIESFELDCYGIHGLFIRQSVTLRNVV